MNGAVLNNVEKLEDVVEVGSFQHSYLQARLAKLLDNEQYMAFVELSFDIGQLDLDLFAVKLHKEMKPGICIYPKRKIDFSTDILKVKEMPQLVVEILSPKQGTFEILEKFKVYFALGIKSCWLVIPINQSITIYSTIGKFKLFSAGEVIDDILGIKLDVNEIFS